MVAILKASQKEAVAKAIDGGLVRYGEHALHDVCVEAFCDASGRTDAALIREFIAQGHACGAIVPTHPMNIIDLAPAGGECAWRVLRAVQDCAQPILYLAVCETPMAAQALLAHPFLQAFVAAGRFAVTVSAREDISEVTQNLESANPFVIVAHGAFFRLRHDLFACHYGDVLEAWVPPQATRARLDVTWRAADDSARGLLSYYVGIMNSAAVSVPTTALTCLQSLMEASGGRYLLLASDAGISNAAQIRLGALMPSEEGLRETGCIPVNFHALSHWQATSGAQTWNSDEGAMVYHVAIRDVACPALADCLPTLQCLRLPRERAQAQMPGLAMALGNSLQPAQAMSLLRACDDSPHVLLTLAPVLVEGASEVLANALPQWRDALARACDQYYPPQQDDGFFHQAALIAMGLDAWGLATYLLDMSIRLYGATCDDLFMLARSLSASGCTQSATSVMHIACEEFPDDERLRDERQGLLARVAAWATLPWYDAALAVDGDVRIEPLGPEHATAFLYQYRDPQIGMMTRLPAFDSDADVVAWITERRDDPSRSDYAVMHREYGFAGVVSANRWGASAFFHFWMGVDFQGGGLGTQAARLLIAQLREAGIAHLLTAVYPDNTRSLRALHALGMQPLPMTALPPEEMMRFYGMALLEGTSDAPQSELLCAALRSHSLQSDSNFQFSETSEPGCVQAKDVDRENVDSIPSNF